MIKVGVKVVPSAEHIGRIAHISLRITDTNWTYISQRITGHLEADESQTAVSERTLYIAVRLYMPSSTTLEFEKILKPTGKGKNKQLYVKWLNWSFKFYSWISSEDIEDKLSNVCFVL